MKDVKRANRSEEGQGQERTENEPEERKGLEGRGAGWYSGGSHRWVGASQRLTQELRPPFTEVSRNPVHPKLQSCWPGICSGIFLCLFHEEG